MKRRLSVPAPHHIAFCAGALALGALMGRFTDWARPPKASASADHAAPLRPQRPQQASANPLANLLAARAVPQDDSDLVGAPSSADAAPFDALASSFRDGMIMTGSTPHRLILFTFDDGPDRHTTPLLLDRLDASGVRAVFFLTGRRIRGNNAGEREQQEIARETMRRGHLVASHTFTHAQLPLLDERDIVQEIVSTEQVFKRVLGSRPWLFRPPGGAHSPRVDRLLAERGYTTMLWNLGAGDFQVRTAEDVYTTWKRVFERKEREGDRGGIILLHDTYEWSVDAYQLIVDDLMARNCKLLDQGEELFDIVDDPRYFFAPRGDAGASAEAAPATLAPEILASRQERLRNETAQRCRSLAMR